MAYLFTQVKEIDGKVIIESKRMYNVLTLLRSHGFRVDDMKYASLDHYLTFDSELAHLVYFSSYGMPTRETVFEVDNSNKSVKIYFPYALPDQWVLVRLYKIGTKPSSYEQEVEIERYAQFIEINMPEDVENVDEFRKYIHEIMKLRGIRCPVCGTYTFFEPDIITGRTEIYKVDDVYLHKKCLEKAKACIDIWRD